MSLRGNDAKRAHGHTGLLATYNGVDGVEVRAGRNAVGVQMAVAGVAVAAKECGRDTLARAVPVRWTRGSHLRLR